MLDPKDKRKELVLVFIEYTKVFDCVNDNLLWETITDMGSPSHLFCLLKKLYTQQATRIWCSGELSSDVHVRKGICQGCILSPYLFNIYGEWIVHAVLENMKYGVSVGGRCIKEQRYVDDTTIITMPLE